MNIDVYEMPLDYGASRHGSDMGPSAIRLAGLKPRLEALGHTINSYGSPISSMPTGFEPIENPKAKYLTPISIACTELASYVEDSLGNSRFPIILGGDHSVALGSIAGVGSYAKSLNKRLGVLYVDAHGDFNTPETSPTGNIHGQCLACSAGYGLPELVNLYKKGVKVDPQNICFVGCRDLDPGEKLLMKEAGVTVFTMSDIERQGFFNVVKKVIVFFKTHCDMLHVSFDMDVLDPQFAPGTGIPLPAGLTNREALLLMEEMFDTGLVSSLEVVEVNPVLDIRNQTAILAVSLISRLMGEKLY